MTTRHRIAFAVLVAGLACSPVQASPDTGALPAAALAAADAQAADLGVVIDYRRTGVDGITVLAVTPAGRGERMGLRAGDRIVAANGQRLSAGNRPSAVLATALASGSRTLQLDVVRDGQPQRLSDGAGDVPADPATAPAGCGHVTARGSHPRAAGNIFPVTILSVDGKNMLDAPDGYHRLDAGRHVLVVREHIDEIRFNAFGLKERARQRQRHGPRLDKVLIVDVQPGTTHAIGAEQASRPIDVDRIRDNSYWQPVVWRSYAEPCR